MSPLQNTNVLLTHGFLFCCVIHDEMNEMLSVRQFPSRRFSFMIMLTKCILGIKEVKATVASFTRACYDWKVACIHNNINKEQDNNCRPPSLPQVFGNSKVKAVGYPAWLERICQPSDCSAEHTGCLTFNEKVLHVVSLAETDGGLYGM